MGGKAEEEEAEKEAVDEAEDEEGMCPVTAKVRVRGGNCKVQSLIPHTIRCFLCCC